LFSFAAIESAVSFMSIGCGKSIKPLLKSICDLVAELGAMRRNPPVASGFGSVRGPVALGNTLLNYHWTGG
jgi:hypothetical protein